MPRPQANGIMTCSPLLTPAPLSLSALCIRGKFAVVKRCVEKATGKVFAAKFLKKRRRGRDCRAEVVHEMAVLEVARNNPRVVNLHVAYETDHDIVLLME